jgi:hypothetical protein
MKKSKLHAALVAVLSVAILNAGGIQAARAAIVDTGSMMHTGRNADLAIIHAQLARDDVRAQLGHFGVASEAIDARLGALSDSELAKLAKQMKEAPAGKGGVVIIAGVVFIVLLILELVGVIDIFKRA